MQVAHSIAAEKSNPVGGIKHGPADDTLNNGKIPMTKTTTPSPESELSPSRAKLLMLQEQHAAIRAAVADDSANANRLNVVHEAVAPAQAALAAYDADHAAAMANWARGLITGRPKADAGRRAELITAVADAEQSSTAAKAAQDRFQADIERASAPLGRLAIAIREAVKCVAIEEATLLLPAIAGAVAAFADLHARLDAALGEVMADIGFGSVEYPEARAALSVFVTARNLSEALPTTGNDGYGEGWRRFTAALERDASISFESAQAMAVQPTPFNPTAVDPATAAMLAAAAFPTL